MTVNLNLGSEGPVTIEVKENPKCILCNAECEEGHKMCHTCERAENFRERLWSK